MKQQLKQENRIAVSNEVNDIFILRCKVLLQWQKNDCWQERTNSRWYFKISKFSYFDVSCKCSLTVNIIMKKMLIIVLQRSS